MNKSILSLVLIAVVGLLAACLTTCSYRQVEPGTVGVQVLFGKVEGTLGPGVHFVNPFSEIHEYDCRWKVDSEENVPVPSQDQLTTAIDISIQYRLQSTMAETIYQDTGDEARVVAVHLVPKVRSALREQGKGIARAEDFFLEKVQATLQEAIRVELETSVTKRGIEIGEVLLRNITLPQFINEAIEQKKEREQATERQKNELERFKVEQEQKLAQAEMERQAAEKRAQQIRVLADANAYEIQKRGEMLQNNPEVLRLMWIERWNGILPGVVAGDSNLLLNLPAQK